MLVITNLSGESVDARITEEIMTVATLGDQPTVGKLSRLGKVLAWKSEPSDSQRQHICLSLLSAISRPSADFADLPDNFRPANSALKCVML